MLDLLEIPPSFARSGYVTQGSITKNKIILPERHYYTYSETRPIIISLYLCLKKIKQVKGEVKYELIKGHEIKDYVTDFQGGLIIESIASNKQLKENDVIIKSNGQRIKNIPNLLSSFQYLKNNWVEMDIIRNKKLVNLKIKLDDRTESRRQSLETQKKDICDAKKSNSKLGRRPKIPFCKDMENVTKS